MSVFKTAALRVVPRCLFNLFTPSSDNGSEILWGTMRLYSSYLESIGHIWCRVFFTCWCFVLKMGLSFPYGLLSVILYVLSWGHDLSELILA